jgi:hypothetical protein
MQLQQTQAGQQAAAMTFAIAPGVLDFIGNLLDGDARRGGGVMIVRMVGLGTGRVRYSLFSKFGILSER